ncbi:Methylcrotonoyl-CoA carboxylase subunit alpha, mitochondrial [Kappamyces sp. JEL0680]|nr:Methylcrotonoyl-CoA carboxylase subunit alpha, mitochondrial [Kappamyces sp. JEL0680]
MKDEFQQFKSQLLPALVSLTQASKFLTPNDVSFYRSDLKISNQIDALSAKTLASINCVAKMLGDRNADELFDGIERNVVEDFNEAVNLLDNVYEKSDVWLETLTKKKAPSILTMDSGARDQKGRPGTAMLRPQLKFSDKIDNSNKPWHPIIKSKPNSSQTHRAGAEVSTEMSLHLQGIDRTHHETAHPYQYEIQNLEYPPGIYAAAPEIPFLPIENTPMIWVDTVDKLDHLCKVLKSCVEFAVDLEHHDYRSFQGFTCLIQVSTRTTDYIIDALQLRSELHLLNDAFTDPKITKVLHGAEMDVQWLQRDFGVYIVNLFDTFHASHVLELPKHSLAFLLSNYCDIYTDKKYQTADWRIRPLSSEMIHYAKTDTHYLLYIFDRMRNEILSRSAQNDNLMRVALERSAETSLKKYEKPIYNGMTGEGSGGWKNLLRKSNEAMNHENLAVLKAIHAWRDHIARKEDESTAYVLPNHMLLKLARFMPTSASDIVAGLSYVPPLVRIHAQDIASLIEQSLLLSRSDLNTVLAAPAIEVPEQPKTRSETQPDFPPAQPAGKIEPHVLKYPVEIGTCAVSSVLGADFDEVETPSAHLQAAMVHSDLTLLAPAYVEDQEEDQEDQELAEDIVEKVEVTTHPPSHPDRKQKNVAAVQIPDPTPAPAPAKAVPRDANFKPFDYSKASDPFEMETARQEKFVQNISEGTSKQAKKNESKKEKKTAKSTTLSGWLLSLIVLVAGLLSASYLTTQTFDFGGKYKQLEMFYRKFTQKGERIFTARELAKYDGSDPTLPIYLAVNGRVYDVSAGPSYYGKGGSYSFFSGKDATRAFTTGCFEPEHLTHDLRGLSKEELTGMDTWIDFYEKSSKYHYVGRVIHDPIPDDAPMPPKHAGTLVAPLFDKILIANRGEIACRVMRTAKKLGIKSVAVYSEADKDSMHVQMADEAYCIGPASSSESYLNVEKILEVAKRSDAKAIHPGYGFLSENSAFAETVAQRGIEFIGPPAQSIIDMGSKRFGLPAPLTHSASKNIMIKAGVPVVPGYHGANQDADFLKNEADKMGYPVLIKAVKGGGGKGMRIVQSSDEFLEMLQSSRREAIKHFSDDAVLVEKYITRPRHVEVQVFADKMGNAVYLFERDCSVQRRHQKILEEAPGPGISPELRASLGEKAVSAAKAVNYVGAGTVEFILDTDTNNFYFMEMNTRLQVEHPITEMVTGTDLVEWQIQVASGNRLPRLQSELNLDGHAFEARIYAENPEKGFLPDTGKLVHIRTPEASSSVRIETGVRQGDEVSVHYDPMISKLVVWSENRTEALRVLRKALGEFEVGSCAANAKVVGPSTNIEFLKALASHPSFIAGDVDTGFIKRHETDLFKPEQFPDPLVVAQTALYFVACERMHHQLDSDSPWLSSSSFRLNSNNIKEFKYFVNRDRTDFVTVQVTYLSGSRFALKIVQSDGVAHTIENCELHTAVDAAQLVATIGDCRSTARVVQDKETIHVFSGGFKYELFAPVPAYAVEKADEKGGSLVTPMPCKISQVYVKAGDRVKKGQTLIVLEAMKMEHTMKSPIDGVIAKVNYDVGELVAEGKRLVQFEEPA